MPQPAWGHIYTRHQLDTQTSSSVSWHSFLFSISTPCSFRNVHKNRLRFCMKFCSSFVPCLYASRRFVVGGNICNMHMLTCPKFTTDVQEDFVQTAAFITWELGLFVISAVSWQWLSWNMYTLTAQLMATAFNNVCQYVTSLVTKSNTVI